MFPRLQYSRLAFRFITILPVIIGTPSIVPFIVVILIKCNTVFLVHRPPSTVVGFTAFPAADICSLEWPENDFFSRYYHR